MWRRSQGGGSPPALAPSAARRPAQDPPIPPPLRCGAARRATAPCRRPGVAQGAPPYFAPAYQQHHGAPGRCAPLGRPRPAARAPAMPRVAPVRPHRTRPLGVALESGVRLAAAHGRQGRHARSAARPSSSSPESMSDRVAHSCGVRFGPTVCSSCSSGLPPSSAPPPRGGSIIPRTSPAPRAAAAAARAGAPSTQRCSAAAPSRSPPPGAETPPFGHTTACLAPDCWTARRFPGGAAAPPASWRRIASASCCISRTSRARKFTWSLAASSSASSCAILLRSRCTRVP